MKLRGLILSSSRLTQRLLNLPLPEVAVYSKCPLRYEYQHDSSYSGPDESTVSQSPRPTSALIKEIIRNAYINRARNATRPSWRSITGLIDKATFDPKVVDGLWDILNDRSKNRRKTIITANLHPKEFLDMITAGTGGNVTKAESLIQRLHPTLVLEFRGESFR